MPCHNALLTNLCVPFPWQVLVFLYLNTAPRPDSNDPSQLKSFSLRILLFHSQQLAVLLSTQVPLPLLAANALLVLGGLGGRSCMTFAV